MKISIEKLKTIIQEELEADAGLPPADMNWEKRSLSIVTMLTNISSHLAAQTDLLKRQTELLERISRNTESPAQRLNR